MNGHFDGARSIALGLGSLVCAALALASLPSALPRPRVAPVVAPQARVDDMIGFIFDDHSWNLAPQNVQRFAAMGGRIARIPFHWGDLERVNNSWDWSEMDSAVDTFVSSGVRVFGILGNPPVTPSWIDRNRFRTVDALPYLAEWRDYVRKVVTRYKDDVKVWEIGNEQFTTLQQMVPFDQYAAFLQASYQEAKAIDPTCTVLMGAIRHQNDRGQIAQYILQPGARDYTDGINFHTLYLGPGQPEDYGYEPAIAALESFALQNGMNTDLYLTESAWASLNTNGESNDSTYVSEPLQAAYSVRTVIIALAHPTMRSVVNAWLVNDSPNYLWPPTFWYWSDTGFIREDGSEKPAYLATRFLHQTLSGADFVSRPSVVGNVQRFDFERADDHVAVFWTTTISEAATYVGLGTSRQPEFFDQVGARLPTPVPVNGNYVFTVTRTPVYVIDSKDPVASDRDPAAVTLTFGDGTTTGLRQVVGPSPQVTNGALRLAGTLSTPSYQFSVPGVVYRDTQELALRVQSMPEDSYVGFLVRMATETSAPWAIGLQTLVSLHRAPSTGKAEVVVSRRDASQTSIVSTWGPQLATDLSQQRARFLVRVEGDRVRAWVNGELGIDLTGIADPAAGGYSGIYTNVDASFPGEIAIAYLALREGDRSVDVMRENDGKVYVSLLRKDLSSTFQSNRFTYFERAPGQPFAYYGASGWLTSVVTPVGTWEVLDPDLMIAEILPLGSAAGLEVGVYYDGSVDAEILP